MKAKRLVDKDVSGSDTSHPPRLTAGLLRRPRASETNKTRVWRECFWRHPALYDPTTKWPRKTHAGSPRWLNVRAHMAQNTNGRRSAIAGRTTRHDGRDTHDDGLRRILCLT